MTPEDEDDGNAAKHIQLRHPRHLTASTRRGRRGTDGTAIAPRRATVSRGDPPPGRAARPVALLERRAQWRAADGGGALTRPARRRATGPRRIRNRPPRATARQACD